MKKRRTYITPKLESRSTCSQSGILSCRIWIFRHQKLRGLHQESRHIVSYNITLDSVQNGRKLRYATKAEEDELTLFAHA